jgi:hypothetical protein
VKERPTPTGVWKRVHRGIMDRLGLPCKLRFSKKHRVGAHAFKDNGGCCITVNPTVAFRNPAHLILHEAAHHALIQRNESRSPAFGLVFSGCCLGGSHCKHWAKILFGMYKKLNIPLPFGTQFETFAEIASIRLCSFEGAVRGD